VHVDFNYALNPELFSIDNTKNVGFAVSASPSDPHYRREMVNFSNTFQNYKIRVEMAGTTNSLGTIRVRVYMNYYDKSTNTFHTHWDKTIATDLSNGPVNISQEIDFFAY